VQPRATLKKDRLPPDGPTPSSALSGTFSRKREKEKYRQSLAYFAHFFPDKPSRERDKGKPGAYPPKIFKCDTAQASGGRITTFVPISTLS
jgi:hypothetical protein